MEMEVELRIMYYNTTLSKGLPIKNFNDFVNVVEHCSQNITVFKCTKKNVLSIVKQLDKDTFDCVGVPGTHKVHCVKFCLLI